jgi:hypothetical protein
MAPHCLPSRRGALNATAAARLYLCGILVVREALFTLQSVVAVGAHTRAPFNPVELPSLGGKDNGENES